jgi:hypothetical protein
MQIKNKVLIVILTLLSLSVMAEIDVKGTADLVHEGWGEPVAKDKQLVKDRAINAALSRWASQQGGSFLKNYDLVRTQIETDINSYVIQSVILTESYDKSAKRLSMVVRVTLDDNRLKNFVNDSSSVANSSSAEKSLLTFVFIARRQDVIQSFDTRNFNRADVSNSEQGIEQESTSADNMEFQSQTTSSIEVTTGGSQTRRSDIIDYTVTSASEINIAMNQVFGKAGFQVVDAEFVEEETDGLLSVEQFKQDYGTGDDISSTTLRNAARGAKIVELPFLAQGALDIGLATDDAATGLKRVVVTVTGKMINLQGRFPINVASVGPVQVAGLGPTVSEAERNALKIAAEQAATELVNQLNSKSIK